MSGDVNHGNRGGGPLHTVATPDAAGFMSAADKSALDSIESLTALAAPPADRLLFWDYSAGGYQFLTLGTNLSISGTTLNATGGSGISDGDYGDITVSGGGTAINIDNGAVTLAKQADMATASVVYRKTAGTGPPEVQSLATLKTDLGLTGTNSGDETASGILTKLLTVDGAGSGLDADLLDGQSSAAFAAASHTHAAGDIASGTIATARLGSGTANSTTYLRGDQTWASPGDVTGPASSVDNEIALFSSTTGKVIKRASTTGILKANSGVIAAATDGTDYYSSAYAIPNANIPNGINNGSQASQSQVVVSGTAYYITRSNLLLPASSKTGGGMVVGTRFVWRVAFTKTAAGTGTFQLRIYRGTNGSTADTADVTQTLGTQTAAVDNMVVDVMVTVTATGATGSYYWTMVPMNKAASATGFGITTGTGAFFSGTVSSVALNTASLQFGLGFISNTGTPTIAIPLVHGRVFNMT